MQHPCDVSQTPVLSTECFSQDQPVDLKQKDSGEGCQIDAKRLFPQYMEFSECEIGVL